VRTHGFGFGRVVSSRSSMMSEVTRFRSKRAAMACITSKFLGYFAMAHKGIPSFVIAGLGY